MSLLNVTDASFDAEVLKSAKLTVVDFWAEWCGPCRALGPVLEEVSKELEEQAVIAKVNVDSNPKSSSDYQITSIPALLFFKNGQVVERLVGAQPKPFLLKKIQEHL